MGDFSLLCNKEILAILDGDRSFGKTNEIDISMPYLSGPDLCDISTNFGLSKDYRWGGQNSSRWSYLDDLLKYGIKNNKVSTILSYLFSKQQFTNKFKNLSPKEIEETYKIIVDTIFEKINGILYCGDNELVINNRQFYVKKIDSEIEIDAPLIKQIDREYIKDLSDKANFDIENSNFDSAITKCRTLVEEVFCYVIEKKKREPSDSGYITKLYAQVKQLYNMHQDKDSDKRINDLLSGLNKIIDSIAQMRNNSSDSHGVGRKRINIEDYHAKLYLNSSIMISEFILSVAKKNNEDNNE